MKSHMYVKYVCCIYGISYSRIDNKGILVSYSEQLCVAPLHFRMHQPLCRDINMLATLRHTVPNNYLVSKNHTFDHGLAGHTIFSIFILNSFMAE